MIRAVLFCTTVKFYERSKNFGRLLVPVLAGFQSEHEVEIPFMLTTDSENPRTGIKTAAHWRCLGLF